MVDFFSMTMAALVAEEGHAAVEEPTAWGFTPTGWVALAMVAVILLMIWKKVPAAIGKALDGKIALIREQLEEAKTLRAEAEALKAEYQAKANAAGAEATAMVERARLIAQPEVVFIVGHRVRNAKFRAVERRWMVRAFLGENLSARVEKREAQRGLVDADDYLFGA